MATEYPLQEGDVQAELARDLLDQAASPDQVVWQPRPDVYGGGVYVLADEAIAQRTLAVRKARRAEEAARIEASLKAAEERDSSEAVASGLATPAEAGFSANAGTDPGSAGEAKRIAETTERRQDDAQAEGAEALTTEDEAEESDEDAQPEETPDETTGERPLTVAQKRAAAKKAKAQQQGTTEEKSE